MTLLEQIIDFLESFGAITQLLNFILIVLRALGLGV